RAFFAHHCSGAFLRELLAFWSDALAREYPALEAQFGKPLASLSSGIREHRAGRAPENVPGNRAADAILDCQFVVTSPVATPSSVRGSHLDKPDKLFAAILYCRAPDDDSTGGDLLLERFRGARRGRFDRRQHVDERFVEPFAEVPYRANTLVAW